MPHIIFNTFIIRMLLNLIYNNYDINSCFEIAINISPIKPRIDEIAYGPRDISAKIAPINANTHIFLCKAIIPPKSAIRPNIASIAPHTINIPPNPGIIERAAPKAAIIAPFIKARIPAINTRTPPAIGIEPELCGGGYP